MAYVFQVDTGGTLTTNLQGYFKLDEASGTRVDVVNGNNFSSTNSVGQDASGKVNQAAAFVSASSQDLRGSSGSIFDITTGDFSIALWFKGNSPTNGACIFSKSINATGQGYHFQITSLHFYASLADTAGLHFHEWRGTTDITGGTWFSCIFTYTASGNVAKIYINNVDETTDAGSSGTVGSLTSIITPKMGARGDTPDQYLNGSIDEFGFWTKVLSSQERTDLYNAGAGQTMVQTFTGEEGYISTQNNVQSRLKAIQGKTYKFYAANKSNQPVTMDDANEPTLVGRTPPPAIFHQKPKVIGYE